MASSAAIKRLSKELVEIESDREDCPFQVYPLEDNFLIWHFTLKGPVDSEYEAGEYHGKITFPADYPFAPPSVMFLTPSGRFDTNVKICLSFTGFHPEEWRPAWGVRTMLLSLREHFRVEDKGSVGFVNMTKAERQKAARKSHDFVCSTCGYNMDKSPERRAERKCQTHHGIILVLLMAVVVFFIAHGYQ